MWSRPKNSVVCEQITLHLDHQWIQKGCNKKHIDFFHSTKQEHILTYD